MEDINAIEPNFTPDPAPAPPMPKSTPVDDAKAMRLVLARVVKERVGQDKRHGWGVEDSLAVINALWQDDMIELPTVGKQAVIRAVINPSAFRQMLEKQGVLTPALTKSVNSILSGLDL